MSVTAHLTGYPRIGPRRELKWALEKMWSGRIERPDFEARVRELRQAHLDEQGDLVGSSTDDFVLYDDRWSASARARLGEHCFGARPWKAASS